MYIYTYTYIDDMNPIREHLLDAPSLRDAQDAQLDIYIYIYIYKRIISYNRIVENIICYNIL